MPKVRIPIPGGQMAEGEEVDVDEANERWSDITLTDGTKIKVKAVVASVIRIDGQYDAIGQPLYLVKSTTAVSVVSVPDNLRRQHQ
jgi:hypothetical protein